MNSIILTDDEKETIQSLISEVEDILAVECVYVRLSLKPGQSADEAKVEILVTVGEDEQYLVSLKKNYAERVAVRDAQNEIKILNAILEKYDRKFKSINDGRCKIMGELSRIYVPWLTLYESQFAAQDLVNGTILYDRFGNLTNIREELEQCTSRESRLPVIENVDSIIGNGSMKSGR